MSTHCSATPRRPPSDDARYAFAAQSTVLPKTNDHLYDQPIAFLHDFREPPFSDALTFVDPRINPFADVFVFLTSSASNAADLYFEFLRVIAEDPKTDPVSRQHAKDQLQWEDQDDSGGRSLTTRKAIAACQGCLGIVLPLDDRRELLTRAVDLYYERKKHDLRIRDPLAFYSGGPIEHGSFVQRFIDFADLENAKQAARNAYGYSEADSGLRDAYEYYLRGRFGDQGTYFLQEWEFFVKANRFAFDEAKSARLPSWELFLDMNAILIMGDTSARPMVLRPDITFFRRSSNHLDLLFDDEGRFDSIVPATVPFEGFFLTKHMYDEINCNGETYSLANELKFRSRLSVEGDPVPQLRWLGPNFKRNFRELDVQVHAPESVTIVFSSNPGLLARHIQRCSEWYIQEAARLARRALSGDLVPASEEFIRELSAIACPAAWTMEAPHVPSQANGRTGQIFERYLHELLGIVIADSIPSSICLRERNSDGTFGSRTHWVANGTWMRQRDRIKVVVQGAVSMRQSKERCQEACERFLGQVRQGATPS